MEILKAVVENIEERYFIKIKIEDYEIDIPMSEENPNAVKSAFNKIIALIKDKDIQIQLEQVGEDLFSSVANEYLTQLNREIKEIRGVMKHYGLISSTE